MSGASKRGSVVVDKASTEKDDAQDTRDDITVP